MKIALGRTFALLIVACILPAGSIYAQVDYYREIQPLFDHYCTACHGNIGGTDLSSYEATMQSEGERYGISIVIPGDPDGSPLVDKIEPSPEYGDRMPLNREPLSEEQIALIRQWIEEGAPERATEDDPLTVDKTEHFKLLKNFPNPFKQRTTFRIWSDRPAQYTVEIFDLQGRKLKNMDGNIDVGATHIPIEMASHSAGVYFYKIILSATDLEPDVLTGSMVVTG